MRAADRRIPPDADGASEAILAFEQWIGGAWLANPTNHRVRKLWRRSDVVSSIELAIIGESFVRLQRDQPRPRLTQVVDTLKGIDYGNQIGAVYELVTAAMLSVPGQRVRLLGPKHPAYDIEVDVAGHTLRLSCKALMPANIEREFERFFVLVEGVVRLMAAAGPLAVVCLHRNQGVGLEQQISAMPFQEMHARWRQGESSVFTVGAWSIRYMQLEPENVAFRFSKRYPSYDLLMLSEVKGNEERRIADKLEEARRKFQAKRVVSDPRTINAVALRLPPSITLRSAAAMINASWAPRDADLGGVLMTRYQVVTSADGAENWPGFQYEWVPNPFAVHALRSESLRATVPIGLPMHGIDTSYIIGFGDQQFEIQSCLVRRAGRRYYEIQDMLGRKGQSFNMLTSPGVETFFVCEGGKPKPWGISPTDSFVYL